MKKRLGFVSNSSSSSFIIIFNKEPKNAQELKEMLFGDKTNISYYDYNVNTDVASEIIFKDIRKSVTQTLYDMFKEIIDLSLYFIPPVWLIDHKDNEIIEYNKLDYDWSLSQTEQLDLYNKKEDLLKSIIKKMFINFNKETTNKFIYNVEFSDNDGEIYTILEHGNVFETVKHIRINNH